jgi:hypothetical protein
MKEKIVFILFKILHHDVKIGKLFFLAASLSRNGNENSFYVSFVHKII